MTNKDLEVLKFDDRLELRARAEGDYFRDGKLDIGLYADEVLFWSDIYIEFTDWLYLYDANRGKWYQLPGPYMIDNLQAFTQMLEQTSIASEPLLCYEVDDIEVLDDLNRLWMEA